jgi:hypothetical protein
LPKTETEFLTTETATISQPVRKPKNPGLNSGIRKENSGQGSAADQSADNANRKDVAGKKRDFEDRETAAPQSVKQLPHSDSIAYGFIASAPVEIKGNILNANGEPVPYATVQLRGTKQATQSDINGAFKLRAQDSTVTVSVNAAGFQKNDAVLNNEENNVVVLKQSSAPLDEVVVSGSAKKRTASPRKYVAQTGELEPENGWSHYNLYIAEQLKEPDFMELEKGGVVKLSFDVSDNGEPINIKVEESACAACNEEAIKLLKEGPKWKKKKNKRGKVSFRF